MFPLPRPVGRRRGEEQRGGLRLPADAPRPAIPIVRRQCAAARSGQSVSSSCRRPWNINEVPPSGRYQPSAAMYGGM